MYDLSGRFNTFYENYVVLPQTTQTDLYHKKDLNIQRLKDGLKEYNNDNDTSYTIVETCVQGSMAMSTIVQNDKSDYDIDVAIVFDKSDLNGKGAQSTRNMVASALKRKTKQFNTAPEVKTSCVRVTYAEGYHIDFAIYRRSWDDYKECWMYEHAGSDWTERDLKGITEWFVTENKDSDSQLRKIVRLSKMFCKSRESWVKMPSGLIQTVISDEQLESKYTRIDELYYYTMQSIVNRLENNLSVTAPVDNGRDLTPRKSDIDRMANWKNRLKSKLEDLDVLFKDDCCKDDAVQAWYGFFNHDYWNEQTTEENLSLSSYNKVCHFSDNEQFIEDLFPVNLYHTVNVDCTISGNGWRPKPIAEFLHLLNRFLPHNLEIKCSVRSSTVPYPYDVYWKVKNVGPEAERRNQLRGQIIKKGNIITEHTDFFGNHYIECYIVKSGICVARQRINIPIGKE